jgi:hypothetical protein
MAISVFALEHLSKYCSLHKKSLLKTELLSDRPEPVEGLTFHSWFDKLTTNGISMCGECGYTIKKNALVLTVAGGHWATH